MGRPLKDVRPIGPFTQSEEFTNKLLGGTSTTEIRDVIGQVIYLELVGSGIQSSSADLLVEDLVESQGSPFFDFVFMENRGYVEGVKGDPNDRTGVIGFYYRVEDGDLDVTLGQIEQFIEQEISSETPVQQVNIYQL